MLLILPESSRFDKVFTPRNDAGGARIFRGISAIVWQSPRRALGGQEKDTNPMKLKKARNQAATALHARLTAAARDSDWRARAGREDGFQGFWEVQVAFYAALHIRLLAEGKSGAAHAQAVFDLMTFDWDQSLRTRGAGEAKTIRLMRRLGRGFYGRLQAYGDALGGGESAPLAEALARNLLVEDESAQATAFAEELCFFAARLEATPREALLLGEALPAFPGTPAARTHAPQTHAPQTTEAEQ